MKRRPSAATTFVGAALLGITAGWVWSRRHDRAHRKDLFSPATHERFAALGWIASQDDASNMSLLQDYLAWETVPALRQRARRILAVLETAE